MFPDIAPHVEPGERPSADKWNRLADVASANHDISMGHMDATGLTLPPFPPPGNEIVRCMLAEDHPGRGIKFEVWPGTWCPNEDKWRYDCSDAGAVWDAIDWFYADPEIVPEKYAQGWFQIRSSKYGRDGKVYACVTTDCDSDGSCDDHKLPCIDMDR